MASLREIGLKIRNLGLAFSQGQELTRAMRRNSGVVSIEQPVTPVTPRKPMPRWRVAMLIAAEEKNPPQIKTKRGEAPIEIQNLVKRRRKSIEAEEKGFRGIQRGIEVMTAKAVQRNKESDEIQFLFEHNIVAGEDEFT